MIVGMDFGTTNTGAAAYDGESIRLLPLDPNSPNPSICRSSIYITRSRDYYLGSTALNLYFNQNVGRPTRYRKIKVGEIIQVFAELPTFYRDVFVYEDEFSPGRLFVSIKTALRNPTYYGTVFLNNWYSASDLPAIFLMGMKLRIDQHLGSPVKEIVLGRPIRFSDDPSEDKIAQSRLLQAAFKAGFEKVYLEYEPVAAALSYERTIKDKQTVLVFDFGGGTLDFTIMEIGLPGKRRILATGGIPIAGDVFDQRLFRATIPRHLGENDYFESGGSRYPIPAHIFDQLSTPQEVLSLNTPQNLEMLRSIHNGAIHKEKTHALLSIISSNYALLMFDLIERAKRQLSTDYYTKYAFKAEDFSIQELILRSKFEQAILHEYEIIRAGLEEVLASSGLSPRDIDSVIRTGGSSQIPLFVNLLNDMFGADKVQQIDVFSSVTSGLAIRAYEVSSGKEHLRQYTPESLAESEEIAAGLAESQKILEVDLGVVKRRLEVARDFDEGQQKLASHAFLLLSEDNLRIQPVEDLRSILAKTKPAAFSSLKDLCDPRSAVFARMEEDLLAITNQFKLISTSIESLLMAQQVSSQSTRDLLRLDAEEMVTAILPWEPEQVKQRFVCIITKYGQARAFDAKLLAEHIAKRPYFQLERRYVGNPACLVPANEEEILFVGTNLGRVAHAPCRDILVVVYDVIKSRRDEQVTAAASFAREEPVLALSDHGYLLPVPPALPPGDMPPASRGQSLRKNFNIAGFLSLERILRGEVIVLTSLMRPVALSLAMPVDFNSMNKPVRAFKLQAGEKILSCLPV